MTIVANNRLFGEKQSINRMNGVWIGARPSVRRQGSAAITVDAHDGLVIGGVNAPAHAAITSSGLTLAASTQYFAYVYLDRATQQVLVEPTSTIAPDASQTFKSTDDRYRYVGFFFTDANSHVVPFITNERSVITTNANPSWVGNPPSLRYASDTTVTIGAHVGMQSLGAQSNPTGETTTGTLDTGSLAASTQYFVYGFLNSNTAIGYEISATAPVDQMKGGDQTRRLVGRFMTDASVHIVPFYQHTGDTEVQEQFVSTWAGPPPSMAWASNSTVTVSAHAGLRSESTRAKVTASATLTLSGPANDTWYAVYAYVSAADGSLAYEISSTLPDAASGYAYKTGDTSRRYVGPLRTDSSGNIRAFQLDGDTYIWQGNFDDADHGAVVNLNPVGAAADSLQSTDCSAHAPAHARILKIFCQWTPGANATSFIIAKHGVSANANNQGFVNNDVVHTPHFVTFEVACTSAQLIDWNSAAAGDVLTLDVVGFVMPR